MNVLWKVVTPLVGIAMAVSLMLGCSGKDSDDNGSVGTAAGLTKTKDNLINIGKALANHEGATHAFPPQTMRDKEGKPLMLSWRVTILPYIEQQALYQQFKLDEPWDSPNNIKLLDRMPGVYEAPYLPETKRGHTYLQVFTGPQTVFRKNGMMGLIQISAADGASNTVLVATAARAVPWTKPEDIEVGADAIKPKMFFGKRGAVILMADGAVRTLSEKVSENTLRSAIDPRDGNPLPNDWLD